MRLAALDTTRKKGAQTKFRRLADLVLRRSTGHASLQQLTVFSAMGAASNSALVHRETLRNAELRVATCFIAECSDHHDRNESELIASPDDTWSFAWVGGRFDATHSDSNRGSKWHVLETSAVYVHDAQEKYPNLEKHVFWVEPEKMERGDAAETWRLVQKQMSSVNIAAFTDEELFAIRATKIRTITATTDGGSDIKKTRGTAEQFVEPRPYVLLMDKDCDHHHQSLMCHTSLARSEQFAEDWDVPGGKIFSTVVKGIHIFRRQFYIISKNYKELIRELQSMADADVTDDIEERIASITALLSKLPDRPCAPRWGSEHAASTYFLQRPPPELISMMKKSNESAASKKRRAHAAAGATLDETTLHDSDHYQQKWGRWSNEFFGTSMDRRFWILLRLGTALRTTYNHLHCYLQTRVPDRLIPWVTEDCARLGAEIEAPLSSDWQWVLLGLDEFPTPGWEPSMTDIFEVVVTFVTMHAADWFRRVGVPTTTMPLMTVWFCKTIPEQRCQRRLNLAKALLTTPLPPAVAAYSQIHKFLNIFKPLLEEVVATDGLCPWPLYNYAKCLGLMLQLCTQAVESTNKIVTGEKKRAPKIADALMRARLVNTKSVWTNCANPQQAANNMLALTDSACHNHKSPTFNDIMNNPDRYTLPQPLPVADAPAAAPAAAAAAAAPAAAPAAAAAGGSPVAPSAPTMQSLPKHLQPQQSHTESLQFTFGHVTHTFGRLSVDDIRWAHPYNLDFYRCWKSRFARYCFYIHKPRKATLQPNQSLWLCTLSQSYQGLCVRCTWTGDELKLVVPLQIALSTHIFAMRRFECPWAVSRMDCKWTSTTTATVSNRTAMFPIVAKHPKATKPKPTTPKPGVAPAGAPAAAAAPAAPDVAIAAVPLADAAGADPHVRKDPWPADL